jgi:predicted transcriptional regulator
MRRLSQLDQKILDALKQRPRSLLQLAAKVEAPVEKVEERCQALADEGLLAIERPDALDQEILEALVASPSTVEALCERVGAPREEVERRHGLMRFYGELSSTVLRDFDAGIFDELEGERPVRTSDLAKRTREDLSRVYRRCQRLAEAFLGSEPVKADRPLYFFPVTGDILTGANYPHLGKVMDDLRGIVARHAIPRGARLSAELKAQLCREYRGYLGRLAKAAEPGEAQQIEAFEGELMKVLSGTTRADVVALFGVRPFWPQVRAWRMRVPANPSWREHWKIGERYWFVPGSTLPGKRMRLRLPADDQAGTGDPERTPAAPRLGSSTRT